MNYKVIQKGQEDTSYMKNFENIVMLWPNKYCSPSYWSSWYRLRNRYSCNSPLPSIKKRVYEFEKDIDVDLFYDKKYNKKLKHCWYMNRKKYL